MVVAEQVASEIFSYEPPSTKTWTSLSKMIRSEIRGRCTPAGGVSTGSGISAANLVPDGFDDGSWNSRHKHIAGEDTGL